MNRNPLSTVTLATIENYRVAANLAAQAYRSGGLRLVGSLVEGLESQLDPRVERVAPRAAARMVQWRARLGEMVTGGIDAVARGTEQVVDNGTALAVREVKRVAEMAAGVETPMLAKPLETAARIALPGAQFALAVSDSLAKGAGALDRMVVGKARKARAGAAVRATETKVRRAKRQVKAASADAVKAVRSAAAKAPARKAPVRRARKAVAAE